MKATACGRKKVQEIYKCNEAESANSYTVEVTAATFTRRRINGIHGYTRCVCNSSKSGMHECTHGYYILTLNFATGIVRSGWHGVQ